MNDKQAFDFNCKHKLINMTVEEIIRIRVDLLIESLYIPEKSYDELTRTDPKRLKKMNIDENEPINWGDLKCCGVIASYGGSYLIIIEEASPDQCPTLCAYVEKFMNSWGWNVIVRTEW